MANGKTAPVTDADSGHIMSISFHSTFTTDASPSIPRLAKVDHCADPTIQDKQRGVPSLTL